MEKNWTEDTDEIVIDLIDNSISRHTLQFFVKGQKRLEPYGSGVLATIHGDLLIFTASHVTEYLAKNSEEALLIRVSEKDYINVVGEIKYTDIDKSEGVDLAYIKVDAQMIQPLSIPYVPLTIDKIRSHHNLFYARNYCVYGFPETNITGEDEPLDTGASFYLTSASKDNRYKKYQYDKRDYIIVDIEGKGIDIKTNEKSKINSHFYGMSGGGLWLLLFSRNPTTGKEEVDYRLVGIMTEFKKGKYFCLIANKIFHIIDALRVIEGHKFREVVVKY